MSFLNSALKSANGPVGLARLLTDRYLHLDEEGRALLALALIAELSARAALERTRILREI